VPAQAPAAPSEAPAARDERVSRLLVAEAVRLRLLDETEARDRYQEARDRILREVVEERLVGARAVVTDAQVEDEYQRNRDKFAGSERLRLRHVFRRVSAGAPAAEKARAAAEMADIRAQIAAGADMAALARTRSDSQTAKYDGLLVPLARGAIDPAVDAVVWELEVGQLSDVVVTPIGLHVFRLEERLEPAPLDETTARNVVRQRLRVAGRAQARRDAIAELLRAASARYSPERALARRPPGEVWYERPGRTITAGDVAERLRALPFAAQRSRTRRDLLEQEVWADLLLLEASRTGVPADPQVATRLAALERDSLREVAWLRRLRLRRLRTTDAELQPFLARTPPPSSPERRALRAVVIALGPDHTAHYWYERAAEVARDVREGRADLAQAARMLSDDPSAESGGALGLATLREVGTWAGTAFMDRLSALPVGETGGPWLVEAYDESQLSYVPRAYAVLRVESLQEAAPLQGAAAREDALQSFMAAQAGRLVRELEDEVLADERKRPS
jgi:PPIC-type PPIASE domain